MISVSEELHTSLDLSNNKAEPPKRSWASDNHHVKLQFEDSSQSIMDELLLTNAPSVRFCQKSGKIASQFVIYSETCRGDSCEECDYIFHHTLPFHKRRVTSGIESYPLLPQCFFVNGKKIKRGSYQYRSFIFILILSYYYFF